MATRRMPGRPAATVEPVIGDDERRRRAEQRAKEVVDSAARNIVDRRAERGETASPYDMLADGLLAVMSDALFDAVLAPGFAESLRERGFVVVPVVDGVPPEAPVEWLQDGIDLYGAAGAPAQLVERVDELWRRAFQAGWDSRAGAPG
jgi:hypothetical protein